MKTLSQTATRVNPDAEDFLDVAHKWGSEDATEGRDQQGSAFFPYGSTAWHSYNEGYAAGCIALAVLTGERRPYWLPTGADVSWNAAGVG